MKKYPFVKQNGLKNCGPACSLMILKYYGGYVSLDKLNEIMRTGKKGTTAYHIIQAFKLFGFKCDGYKYDDISQVSLPSIMHIKTDSYTHYVVLWEIKKDYVIIGDPFRGTIKMSISEFLSKWTGYTISMILVKKIINEEKPKVFRFLYNLIKPNIKKLILIGILSLLTVIFSLVNSFFVQMVINNIKNDNLRFILFFFSFVMIINVITSYFRNILMTKFGNILDKCLSFDTFSSIIKLPYKACRDKTTGETLSYYNDLFLIKNFLLKLFISLFVDIPLIVLVFIYFFKISFFLSLILFVTLVIHVSLYLFYKRKIYFLANEVFNSKSFVNSFITECVIGFESIRNLNIQTKMIGKFKNIYENYYSICGRYGKLKAKDIFFKELLFNLYFILIVLCGLIFSMWSVSNFFTIYFLSSLFITSIQNICDFDFEFNEIVSSISHIQYLYQNKLDKKEIGCFGNIDIKNLSYSFDGINMAIQNINLKITRGEKVLVSGESGSGKSTLFKIIKGYFDNFEGDVMIDGNSIKNYEFNDVLYVSPKETLFTGKVLDNLEIRGLGYDDICEVSEFIEDYNYIIEEDGFNLSSGQRQRIGLARAVNFNILIIDEGLSEVDINMERRILKRLFDKYSDKTIIFISHRLDNLDLFDRFLKLSSGNVIIDEVRCF